MLSHVQLFVTPWAVAHQAPPSMGFPRQGNWSGLPFPSPMDESEKWKVSRSVMSDSQGPHGLQPTRLLSPWDFLGKSTGVGCHPLLWSQATAWQTSKHSKSHLQCRRHVSCGFSPWVGKIPWSRKWQPTPVFLPEKFHGQRSLVGYNPCGRKESLDTTEATKHIHTYACKVESY